MSILGLCCEWNCVYKGEAGCEGEDGCSSFDFSFLFFLRPRLVFPFTSSNLPMRIRY